MERLVALIVAGLRVGVATDGLQYPLGFLELHLYVFLLLQVHFLFALPLAGRRAVLMQLLHLFTELFRELLDLPALQRAMARGVVHWALRVVVVAIGQLTGAFVASWPLHGPHSPLQLRRWVLRLAVDCRQCSSSSFVVVVAIAAALGLCPSVGLALPLHHLGD
jgi:hypothetical protein